MGIGVILLTVFGALAVIFMIVGYRLPSERVAQAEIVLPATPEQVYGYVSQIKNWQDWRLMPEILAGMNVSISGPANEKGATLLWKSGDDGGSIEFLEMVTDAAIAYRFSLGKKKGMMDCFLEIHPVGLQTRVMSKAVLVGGATPATRILAWMMESVVRKDLESSLQRLRLVFAND